MVAMLARLAVRKRESLALEAWLSLPTSFPGDLSDYLYNYGHFASIEDPDTLAQNLGSALLRWHQLIGGGRGWGLALPPGGGSPWTAFERRVPVVGAELFKAYLSFPPEWVLKNLEELLDVLTSTECLSFKVATTRPHVLRADAFVAYAGGASALDEMLGRLNQTFTAQAPSTLLLAATTDHPNLFWAVDRRTMSWRKMASAHVAIAFEGAQGGLEGRLAAVAGRLRLLGLCPLRWMPEAFLRTLDS